MNIVEISKETSKAIAQADIDGKTVHFSGIEADNLMEYLKDDYDLLLEEYIWNRLVLSEAKDVIITSKGKTVPYISPVNNSENQ